MDPSSSSSTFDKHAFLSKIPYSKSDEEYRFYERLIPELQNRKPSDIPRIVVITDAEKDYDDLIAIVVLCEMYRLGVVEIAGIIANHKPARRRAKFLRTIVHLLGMAHIEVAEGTDGVEDPNQTRFLEESYYELKNTTFEEQEWNKKPFRRGAELIDTLAKQVDNEGKEPLTVLLISSLQDISDYFNSHKNDPHFLPQHFKKFVSQGGYEITGSGDTCTLNPIKIAQNNSFHPTAAKNYTDCLVEFKLASDAWSREAAKAACLDGSIFANLDEYGPIGAHLAWVYRRLEFKFFWDPFNAPYMPRLDPKWYVTTRLGLNVESNPFKDFDKSPPGFIQVLPHSKIIAYDGCAAIGTVGDHIMRALGIMSEPEPYNKAAHQHRLFGRTQNDLGGINALKLRETLRVFFFGALKFTSKSAEQLIPSRSIKHKVDDYKVTLDIFDQQVPYLKKSRELAEAAKKKEIDMEELERLQTEKGLDRSEAEKELRRIQREEELKQLQAKKGLERSEAEEELERIKAAQGGEVPKEIPYELLYQRAVSDKSIFPQLNNLFWKDPSELVLAINNLSDKNRSIAIKQLRASGQNTILAKINRR
ncbi:hypothetical protein QBC47DRAFT_423862 [Echria macrotheca]|uniref:Uncharacterized protein n=1 Tax=Echria macrotheca TaxID=438768 RepID=A0AAJ0BBC6_9PEZI|nr:hypothetical protein QBC47DRAFT_423862 [Echria macrotheca]